jgi:hypothetical protein
VPNLTLQRDGAKAAPPLSYTLELIMSFSSPAYSGRPRIVAGPPALCSGGLLAGARRPETTASPVTNRSRLAPAWAVVSRRFRLALHATVRAAHAPASGRSVTVSASCPLSSNPAFQRRLRHEAAHPRLTPRWTPQHAPAPACLDVFRVHAPIEYAHKAILGAGCLDVQSSLLRQTHSKSRHVPSQLHKHDRKPLQV